MADDDRRLKDIDFNMNLYRIELERLLEISLESSDVLGSDARELIIDIKTNVDHYSRNCKKQVTHHLDCGDERSARERYSSHLELIAKCFDVVAKLNGVLVSSDLEAEPELEYPSWDVDEISDLHRSPHHNEYHSRSTNGVLPPRENPAPPTSTPKQAVEEISVPQYGHLVSERGVHLSAGSPPAASGAVRSSRRLVAPSRKLLEDQEQSAGTRLQRSMVLTRGVLNGGDAGVERVLDDIRLRRSEYAEASGALINWYSSAGSAESFNQLIISSGKIDGDAAQKIGFLEEILSVERCVDSVEAVTAGDLVKTRSPLALPREPAHGHRVGFADLHAPHSSGRLLSGDLPISSNLLVDSQDSSILRGSAAISTEHLVGSRHVMSQSSSSLTN